MIARADNDGLMRRYERLRREQDDLERRAQDIEDELIRLEWLLPVDYLYPGDLPWDEPLEPEYLQRTVEHLIGFKLDGVPKSIIEQALHEPLHRLATQLSELADGV